MEKKDCIIFLGSLATAYARGVLCGVAQTLESQPALQGYAVHHVDIHEIYKLDTRGVAGMLVASLGDQAHIHKTLADTRIPMVSVVGDKHTPWLRYCVRADNEAIGRVAAAHLLGLGFRRFAFLGHGGHLAMARRGEGFTAAIAERNFEVRCFSGSADRAGRRMWPPGMREWIEKIEKPAAVFCCNDLRANALMLVCHSAGIRVPEDIAVLGVDDDDIFAKLQRPHISSIPVQTQLIAERALLMLVQLIENQTPLQTLSLVKPGPVVMRASTNIMAVEDELVRHALAYIRQNLSHGISIKHLVSELNVSRPTLEKRFAAMLGRSPASEIRRLQIEQACDLLTNTELSMPMIALRTGFSSAQQLSTSFKRYTQQSPTQYRIEHSPRVRREISP